MECNLWHRKHKAEKFTLVTEVGFYVSSKKPTTKQNQQNKNKKQQQKTSQNNQQKKASSKIHLVTANIV